VVCPSAFGSESSDELVRQARAHETAHEDDLAARRYTEALTLDALNAPAWLGLGELRLRTGEPIEAERVYTAALARLPLLIEAFKGRAEARWASGRRVDAETDLQAFSEASADPSAYRELANWFGTDGRSAAQLATWRHILSMPAQSESALREARRIVTALIIIVGDADPACWPIEPDPTRFALARICPRGGTTGAMTPSVDAH
jgi:tetratricopeptide (TPR) repeat protein